MRTIFIFTTLFLFWGLPSASAFEVKVGLYENPPKIFTEKDGTAAGIFVDIIEEIARREGWSLKYVHGTWPQCLGNLELEKIDVMPDVAYSDKRAEKYDFCTNSVISNWAQVYTRKGVKVKLITDLAGKHLATLNQGIHLVRLQDLANGFGFQFEMTTVDNYETVFACFMKRMSMPVSSTAFTATHRRINST